MRDDRYMALDTDAFNRLAKPGLEALANLLTEGVADYAPAPDGIRPYLVGWGLAAALHRQAAAVVVLHDNELAHEAAPNRRLMVEYVAHLQWLARDGDEAVECMNKAFQHVHSGLRKAADAAGYQYDETAANAVRDADIPGNPANQYNSMRHLLNRLGGGLLESWLGETQLSHPTLTAAQCFYQDSDDAIKLFLAPEYGIDGDPTDSSPYVAFFFLFLGLIALNDLLAGSPWTDDLRAIGEAAGLAGAI